MSAIRYLWGAVGLGLAFALLGSPCLWDPAAAAATGEPPKLTSLSDPKVRYEVPKKPYVVLKRSGIEAVIANNEAVDDAVLPRHRAGYSGVASLTGAGRKDNFFVPGVAGLNYEHIHDGTTQNRTIQFEPRNAPMELRVIDEHTAEVYQAPTPFFALESCLRYRLLEDGVIEMTLECIPRKATFKNGYIGLFWASYIHQPKSLDIHFKGHGEGEKETRWIRGVTPKHGVEAVHVAHDDQRQFKHDADFPLLLVFNRSKWRYREPWYYGVNGEHAYVQMFRPKDRILLTQSPSGGGTGNPAWDFQFYVEDYRVGERYQMVMRAMLLRFESAAQVEAATAKHRQALGP
jgi:hypothetical protein